MHMQGLTRWPQCWGTKSRRSSCWCPCRTWRRPRRFQRWRCSERRRPPGRCWVLLCWLGRRSWRPAQAQGGGRWAGIHSPTCGRAGVRGGIQSCLPPNPAGSPKAPARPFMVHDSSSQLSWRDSLAARTRERSTWHPPSRSRTPVSPLHPSACHAPRLVEGARCSGRPREQQESDKRGEVADGHRGGWSVFRA